METIGEIIPFAKEMLNQRPNRGMLKIYMLGSTMVVLGVIGALAETVFLPYVEQETIEDAPAELIVKRNKEKKQLLRSGTFVDTLQTVVTEAKAEHLVAAGRRDSNRIHAS